MCDLLRPGHHGAAAAVQCVGGYWQPKYSVPNARMVEAVQTGRAHRRPAARPGLHRQGHGRSDRRWRARASSAREERVLFLHTGGLPSLFVYDDVLLGRQAVTNP